MYIASPESGPGGMGGTLMSPEIIGLGAVGPNMPYMPQAVHWIPAGAAVSPNDCSYVGGGVQDLDYDMWDAKGITSSHWPSADVEVDQKDGWQLKNTFLDFPSPQRIYPIRQVRSAEGRLADMGVKESD